MDSKSHRSRITWENPAFEMIPLRETRGASEINSDVPTGVPDTAYPPNTGTT